MSDEGPRASPEQRARGGVARLIWTVLLGLTAVLDGGLVVLLGKPRGDMSGVMRAELHFWPAVFVGVCWCGRVASGGRGWRAALALLFGALLAWICPMLIYAVWARF